MTKNLPLETIKQKREKLLSSEILNEEMIIEVDDDQIHRENVMRHILSSNIKLLFVCDHIYGGTKEYGIRIQTRDLEMKMGIYETHGKI